MLNRKCPHCGVYYKPITKLKEHRLAAGKKIADISAASGLTQQSIRMYEEGSLPRSSKLLVLAEAYGLSVADFLAMTVTNADGSPVVRNEPAVEPAEAGVEEPKSKKAKAGG